MVKKIYLLSFGDELLIRSLKCQELIKEIYVKISLDLTQKSRRRYVHLDKTVQMLQDKDDEIERVN